MQSRGLVLLCWALLLFVPALGCGGGETVQAIDDELPFDLPGGQSSTEAGLEIVQRINAYRTQNGLPAIPVSPSLSFVADAHVHDLDDNSPDAPLECNPHSWSDQGPWTACCYTSDGAQAQCMWNKPSELTSYAGRGYENAASGVYSAESAVEGWMNSPAHNGVILNLGMWESFTWNAIGAAMHGGYAVVWFGEELDA